MSIAIGQKVQVNEGQLDEETGTPMGGWSGRVIEKYPKYNTIQVEWDSFTLLHLPDAYIRHSLDGGYDYFRYTIESENVRIIEPKDTPEQVDEIRDELEARYHDYELYGDPPYPFSAVEREAFSTELLLPQSFTGWLEYLEKHLEFPFRAKVVEGRPYKGQTLDVLALDDYEDPYGVFAVIKWTDGGAGNFLLGELEAVNKDSSNYRLLRKYVIWFANR